MLVVGAMPLALLSSVPDGRRWSESEILRFMTAHPSRVYFSRLFKEGGMRTGMEVGAGRFSEHLLRDAGAHVRAWYVVEPAPTADFMRMYPPAAANRTRTPIGASSRARGMGYRAKLIHLPFESMDPRVFKRVAPASLDFAYIDLPRKYVLTSQELSAYWKLLRPGGVLAGNDYCDQGESEKRLAGQQRCRGCSPVPRCSMHTKHEVQSGMPPGSATSHDVRVRAVQGWATEQGGGALALHATSENFTRESLASDGIGYDMAITSTRVPSWFLVKGDTRDRTRHPPTDAAATALAGLVALVAAGAYCAYYVCSVRTMSAGTAMRVNDYGRACSRSRTATRYGAAYE